MNATALPDASPGVSPSQSAPPSSGASRRHVDIPFLASSAFLALVVVLALIGPLLVGDPGAQNLLQRLSPPGTSGHLLGTDQLGRDVLARLVVGSRISVLVGVTAALLSGVIGSAIGILAGYTGGWTDRLLMRLTDVQLAFPTLLLALAVIGFVGPGLTTVIVVLGITGWVSYARVLRSEVLSLRTREFVEAAQVMGVPAHRIMLRHMLPNVTGPLATILTLQVGTVILAEAALSFLGLGIPATIPTWGSMLADGQLYMGTAWWLAVLPGTALLLTVLSINIAGDAVRDRFDPRTYSS
ncbi:Dipeptide transport system permease protein DppC (TC 3.A.1.5.2) [Corynebacterium xerosis]|nr:Dipeptide transport system permease protein DppC (TC 3.A.1.5.2) [Corynebacterium xerosis]